MSMRLSTLAVVCALLTGCSVGGHYTPEGPHPHVNVAGAVHVGPVELLHTSASNAKPVTDLTALTVNTGPTFGNWQLLGGVGWQFSRMWGACDAQGYNCEKTWADGFTAAFGVTYRESGFRADLRLFSYDNSPVGADVSLPYNLEAAALIFGFDL